VSEPRWFEELQAEVSGIRIRCGYHGLDRSCVYNSRMQVHFQPVVEMPAWVTEYLENIIIPLHRNWPATDHIMAALACQVAQEMARLEHAGAIYRTDGGGWNDPRWSGNHKDRWAKPNRTAELEQSLKLVEAQRDANAARVKNLEARFEKL
jgi:hypothetical protein